MNNFQRSASTPNRRNFCDEYVTIDVIKHITESIRGEFTARLDILQNQVSNQDNLVLLSRIEQLEQNSKSRTNSLSHTQDQTLLTERISLLLSRVYDVERRVKDLEAKTTDTSSATKKLAELALKQTKEQETLKQSVHDVSGRFAGELKDALLDEIATLKSHNENQFNHIRSQIDKLTTQHTTTTNKFTTLNTKFEDAQITFDELSSQYSTLKEKQDSCTKMVNHFSSELSRDLDLELDQCLTGDDPLPDEGRGSSYVRRRSRDLKVPVQHQATFQMTGDEPLESRQMKQPTFQMTGDEPIEFKQPNNPNLRFDLGYRRPSASPSVGRSPMKWWGRSPAVESLTSSFGQANLQN